MKHYYFLAKGEVKKKYRYHVVGQQGGVVGQCGGGGWKGEGRWAGVKSELP